MKTLITSDIHGSEYYVDQIVNVVEKENIEQVFLLGDIAPTNMQILLPKYFDFSNPKDEGKWQSKWIEENISKIPVPVYYLEGNHDFFKEEQIKSYMTHLKHIQHKYQFDYYELITPIKSGRMLKSNVITSEGNKKTIISEYGLWHNERTDSQRKFVIKKLNKYPILLSHSINKSFYGNKDESKTLDCNLEEYINQEEVKKVYGGHIHINDEIDDNNIKKINVSNEYNFYNEEKELNYSIIYLEEK